MTGSGATRGSPWFPLRGPPVAAPFPPPGPPRRVPRLQRYYGAVRRPAALPAALRFLRTTVPPRASVFVSPASPTPAWGLEFSGLATPGQLLSRWRRPGLPSSWGTLVSLCPVLRPRQVRTHQAIQCGSTAPALSTAKAPRDQYLSGLNHTALGLAVYASQPPLPEHHARLASGRWPGSPGWYWLPIGFR